MSTPRAIGRYEVRAVLGQGGMGTLYRAWDPRLDRTVAIKTIRASDDGELRERFAFEARSAAGLRHPNIVTIYDVGEHDGQPFIAMEYLQGETLDQLIRRPLTLSVARRIEILEQLCDGMSFAHRAGIVHRDIKPANLIVTADGVLKILDFGIARAARSKALTQAGSVLGTLAYMSPERILGEPADERGDIFSVGLVAYELLSGRKAFPDELKDGLLHQILHGSPIPLPTLVPHLDSNLTEIVEKAIEKDPKDRYQHVDDMRVDLERVRHRHVSGAAAAAETVIDEVLLPEPLTAVAARRVGQGLAERARSPSRADQRPRGLLFWLAVGLVVALAGIAGVLLARRPDSPSAPVRSVTPAKVPPRGSPVEATEGDPVATRGEAPADADVEPALVGQTGLQSVEPPRSRGGTLALAGERTEGAVGTTRARRAEPPPAECARLLERVSLGEQLTASEKELLRSRCR